jgi:hypothetical protein
MTALSRTAALLLAALVLASPAWAEDVENPEYKQWSNFKAGAMSKWKMTGSQGGQQIEAEMSATLKSVEDEQAVVSHQVTVSMMGQQMPMPAQDRVVPARVDADEVDPIMGKLNDPNTEKGQETLEIAGQKIDCTWYKVDSGEDEDKVSGRIWISEQVPGQLVKLEARRAGTDGGEQNMILTEFKTE